MFTVRLALAEVDLEAGELEFLNPMEEGMFYPAKGDFSSWSRQAYTIYHAKDGQLIPITTITYVNSSKSVSADDENVKVAVKRAFATAENNKTRTALIEGAKEYIRRAQG